MPRPKDNLNPPKVGVEVYMDSELAAKVEALAVRFNRGKSPVLVDCVRHGLTAAAKDMARRAKAARDA